MTSQERLNEWSSIAKYVGLTPKQTKRFVKFAEIWSNLKTYGMVLKGDYAIEWAEKFKSEKEYRKAASSNTVFSLILVDGEATARKKLYDEYVNSWNWELSEAKQHVNKMIKDALEFGNTNYVDNELHGYATKSPRKHRCLKMTYAKNNIFSVPNFNKGLKRII
jgi:hypothetical protein